MESLGLLPVGSPGQRAVSCSIVVGVTSGSLDDGTAFCTSGVLPWCVVSAAGGRRVAAKHDVGAGRAMTSITVWGLWFGVKTIPCWTQP